MDKGKRTRGSLVTWRAVKSMSAPAREKTEEKEKKVTDEKKKEKREERKRKQ